MEREQQIIELLHETRGLLAYQKSCSIFDYPKTPELESFLENCNWKVSAPEKPVLKAPVAKPAAKVKVPAPEKVVQKKKSEQKNLTEIAAEIAICTSCSLAAKKTCSVPGIGGGAQIRLLLVGHWLPAPGESTAVFGAEEDFMLKRMLTAIHLSMDEVFVTNIIKCGVGEDTQPQAEHIDACASYLERQIAAAAPELICTMGMVATKTLLRLPQPLSMLRGQFYSYKGTDGLEIPLLPTYHPAYLLANPEMKQATWQDLQALEQRLLEIRKAR